MPNEIILTIFITLFIPFCKWYLDIKLEEQTEDLNKLINLNNNVNKEDIFNVKQQLSLMINQFNYFNKTYQKDVKILKSKLLNSDESLSREDFK